MWIVREFCLDEIEKVEELLVMIRSKVLDLVLEV